jgi:hypothetical protein
MDKFVIFYDHFQLYGHFKYFQWAFEFFVAILVYFSQFGLFYIQRICHPWYVGMCI